MSRTYKILLVLVVAVIAGGGYWKLALAPKRVEAAELADRVAVAEQQVAQQQALINTYAGAEKQYGANYETVVRLGKAVPGDDDTRSLLVQLDASSKRAGVDFDAISLNAGGSAAEGSTPVAPGAINAGTFSAMPFSFAFTGSFDSLGGLFSRLERFVTVKGDQIAVSGRLVRIESLTLSPGERGWPTLTAQVGASAYIVPESPAPGAAATDATTDTTTTTSADTP